MNSFKPLLFNLLMHHFFAFELFLFVANKEKYHSFKNILTL